MKNYHFKEGEEVAHKEYITQKMSIRELCRKKVKSPIDGKEIEKFIGLRCDYWVEIGEGKKELRKHVFHSRELVPWEVAQKGNKAVVKWLTGEAGNDDETKKHTKTKKVSQE